MASFWRETNWFGPKKNNLKESSWFGEPKCNLRSEGAHFLFFLTDFFYPCCSNYVRMKDILWMEDIVEYTPTPPFYINFRIDMTGFVDPHKMIPRRSAFSALSSARNESENWKKKAIKKRPKINLILSHFNHTFFILGPWLNPKSLDTLILP